MSEMPMGARVLRFLFPWTCAVCGSALECVQDSGFCGLCWMALPRINDIVCRSCGLPMPEGGEQCFACRQEQPKIVIRAAGLYEKGLRSAILRYKFRPRPSLSSSLSLLLRWAWERYPELHSADLISAIPLHPRRQRERGFNQAEILAQALAVYVNLPFRSLLLRTRSTRSQASLKKPDRLKNLSNAFQQRPEIRSSELYGKTILLIDDVCTTGATIFEAARALQFAGAMTILGLVLARDPVTPVD